MKSTALRDGRRRCLKSIKTERSTDFQGVNALNVGRYGHSGGARTRGPAEGGATKVDDKEKEEDDGKGEDDIESDENADCAASPTDVDDDTDDKGTRRFVFFVHFSPSCAIKFLSWITLSVSISPPEDSLICLSAFFRFRARDEDEGDKEDEVEAEPAEGGDGGGGGGEEEEDDDDELISNARACSLWLARTASTVLFFVATMQSSSTRSQDTVGICSSGNSLNFVRRKSLITIFRIDKSAPDCSKEE